MGTADLAKALELWIREIIIVLFLAGLLEMLLPENDLKRFARVAVGFFVVLAVGRPLLAAMGSGFVLDRELVRLASWELGYAPAGQGSGEPGPLGRGAALRETSRDRALAATQAALESQVATLARREPGVREAQAEVDLVSDPSSPVFGNLQAVRLRVWLSQPPPQAPEAAQPNPVVVSVEPVIVSLPGAGGVTLGSREGSAPGATTGGGEAAPGRGVAPPAAASGDDADGSLATPAGQVARRLRSELVLLLGVPAGGVTVEVWP